MEFMALLYIHPTELHNGIVEQFEGALCRNRTSWEWAKLNEEMEAVPAETITDDQRERFWERCIAIQQEMAAIQRRWG